MRPCKVARASGTDGMTSSRFWPREMLRGGRGARVFAVLGVLAVLGLLLSHEISAWRKFDWRVFYTQARHISIWRSVSAVAITYAGILLRAARWSVFLRRVKEVPAARLFGPTMIGYAGLALLGRPGELIRPWLIARKERLSLSSQMAILTLERIFDTAAVGMLIAAAILSSSQLQALPYLSQFRRGGFLLIVLIAFLALPLFLFAKKGEKIAFLLERMLSHVASRPAQKVAEIVNGFADGLKVIQNTKSLIQLIFLSISIWLFIALAYLETLHAFNGLRGMSLMEALLLLGFSLLGSLVQLPGGGTQQLIVIAALINVFGVRAELAVSCSMLGWLTIFMAPVPVGLALLRHERLSLRRFLQNSKQSSEPGAPCGVSTEARSLRPV